MGGVFQYSQVMLTSFSRLKIENIETLELVVAYKDNVWKDKIVNLGLNNIKLKPGIWADTKLDGLFGVIPIVLKVWRKLGPLFSNEVRQLRREQCDLWIFPDQDYMSHQSGVNSLATIHDLMHRYENRFPELAANGKGFYRDRHSREISRFSLGVLVDSIVGQTHVCESYGVAPEKVFVLPFIAPGYLVLTDGEPSLEINTKIKNFLPKKFVFYPAQFWKHKNHLNLIRAIWFVKKSNPDIKLVLVGSKKNGYKEVIDLCKKLDLVENIFFLGYVPDAVMLTIYKSARAMVMASFTGPTHTPIAESFLVGCPVASSSQYGASEQVGDAGLLFDPHNPSDIAEAIIKLWTDDKLCKSLIEKGRMKSMNWGQEHFTQRLSHIINTIILNQKELI
jgi:glycosyltransferase involved in cell wall biosynthesis